MRSGPRDPARRGTGSSTASTSTTTCRCRSDAAGTSAHARARPPRGVRLHPRDLARRRRAPRAARNRTAGRGSCLAGDAADELEHGRPRGGDPRGRARPPRRALELGAPSAGLGRRGRRPRRGRPGLGHTSCREGRVSRLGEVGAFEQERPARQRRLRLGLELRRARVARAQDDGADDRGAADLALLAGDHARRLQRRLLARVDARGAAGPALRPLDAASRAATRSSSSKPASRSRRSRTTG